MKINPHLKQKKLKILTCLTIKIRTNKSILCSTKRPKKKINRKELIGKLIV